MPVGPLALQTINQGAVDREAQIQGAPTYSKLRRALQSVTTAAANEDNPAKKREMLRAAMEGTGTGISDASLAAHKSALSKVAMDTEIANRGAELTFQNAAADERQQVGIASSEKMQGLSLAEARAAQERGITAEQAMQEKGFAASEAAQGRSIASSEKMQGLSLTEAREAQARGISSQQALQEKQIKATKENQAAGIASSERIAQLNRESEREQSMLNAQNQFSLAGFNAQMTQATAEYKAPAQLDYSPGTKFGQTLKDPKAQQWQNNYKQALSNFYAQRP